MLGEPYYTTIFTISTMNNIYYVCFSILQHVHLIIIRNKYIFCFFTNYWWFLWLVDGFLFENNLVIYTKNWHVIETQWLKKKKKNIKYPFSSSPSVLIITTYYFFSSLTLFKKLFRDLNVDDNDLKNPTNIFLIATLNIFVYKKHFVFQIMDKVRARI